MHVRLILHRGCILEITCYHWPFGGRNNSQTTARFVYYTYWSNCILAVFDKHCLKTPRMHFVCKGLFGAFSTSV